MIAALGGGWLLWIAWLAWENRRHQKNLDALRLRVHVNGTRGKSSVTRLIAAGLRAGGYRTVAKVTGTAARIIGPDGSESPVARRGPANIREYLRTVEQAVACGADALVAECMALQPELQGFCERRLMRSHIGVITNVRHDHEEIMGWNLQAIAASLGRTAPQQGTLVTTTETAKLLQTAGCIGDGTALRIVSPSEISAAEMEGFLFAVEPENVALALSVCELAGVNRQAALAGMQRSQPDSGNLTMRGVEVAGHTIRVIDAMAANDPDSTASLWQRYVGGAADAVLLHTRADRRLRTEKLCERLADLHAGVFYLCGDSGFAADCLRRQGVSEDRLVRVGEASLAAVAERLVRHVPPVQHVASLTLFAAGNRKGFVV